MYNKTIHQRSQTEIKQVSGAIEEYRAALQECKKNKNQDTAEILNRESSTANFMYWLIKPDLTAEQRFEYIMRCAKTIPCPRIPRCPVILDGDKCLCTTCSTVQLILLTAETYSTPHKKSSGAS